MPERIPQSTVVRIPLYAVLNTDHLSPATGKTIAITISKNGGAFGNPSVGATNATEIANGWYYYDTSTTDTGTLGPLIVRGVTSPATTDEATIAYNVVNATTGGLTALPDALPGATNGLFIAGTNAATTVTTSFTTTFTGNLTGSVGSVTGAVGSVTGAVGSVTGNVGGNVTGSVGSVAGNVTGSVGSVAGNVTGSVGSVASGGIAAASFAAGAINAAAIADGAIDAATFASGALDAVWSTASRTLTAWSFQLPANGLANVTAWTVNITGNITGNLTGSVGSVVGFDPADVTDIKAQTDLLTFSGDGVDANVASVNEVTVTGTGVVGDTWGP